MNAIEIKIPIKSGTFLYGNLNVPEKVEALVVFSHGSGSSRFSVRNNFVAEVLNNANIATLLTDLLTIKEDTTYENRFNIELLSERLVSVTNYAVELPGLEDAPIGYFGASTGAASALTAAAKLPELIRAVVSRGGRPDLAKDALPYVKAPTLLIVGSLDREVITLNDFAYGQLNCEKRREIISGASHLFEEPGTLEDVAQLAQNWFAKYLVDSRKPELAR
jgi:putative phosphoribosyl transferase